MKSRHYQNLLRRMKAARDVAPEPGLYLPICAATAAIASAEE